MGQPEEEAEDGNNDKGKASEENEEQDRVDIRHETDGDPVGGR